MDTNTVETTTNQDPDLIPIEQSTRIRTVNQRLFRDLEEFYQTRILSPNSNPQFRHVRHGYFG